MSRKKYITPEVFVANLDFQNVLCLSDVTSDKGIGYGGVDEDGSVDPSAPKMENPWTAPSWESE